MSLRKGDNKKTAQKYKNRTAFKITFDTKAIEMHQKVALDKLCPKCVEIIRWKMQYNKYKKSTSERRCVMCLQKNIYKSYRHACDNCSRTNKVCAKCLQPSELTSDPNIEKLKEETIQKEMEEYLTHLRERTRRTLQRKIMKDLVKWDDDKKHFIEIESGLRLDNLKFKQGLEFEDDVEAGDECEEFKEGDFEKKAETQQEPIEEGEANKKEEQTIPTVGKPKTQKEMLELAKQIDFGSSDEDDDDEDEDGNDDL